MIGRDIANPLAVVLSVPVAAREDGGGGVKDEAEPRPADCEMRLARTSWDAEGCDPWRVEPG